MALQAQQIVSLATQIAKCPAYVTQAGQLLNTLLQDICQDYDLDLSKGVTNFNFNPSQGIAGGGFSPGFSPGFSTGSAYAPGSGPYTLPSDWLRARRNDVFYTIDGVKYVLIGVELAEFDALVQQAGLSSYPENYAVDNAPISIQGAPVMYVWPPPAGAYPFTARYQRQMPDIVNPETSASIPWFNNTNYLKTELAAQLMELTNDDRASTFHKMAELILTKYLKSDEDSADVVKTVTFDRRRFGSAFNRVPNTKMIGW